MHMVNWIAVSGVSLLSFIEMSRRREAIPRPRRTGGPVEVGRDHPILPRLPGGISNSRRTPDEDLMARSRRRRDERHGHYLH